MKTVKKEKGVKIKTNFAPVTKKAIKKQKPASVAERLCSICGTHFDEDGICANSHIDLKRF